MNSFAHDDLEYISYSELITASEGAILSQSVFFYLQSYFKQVHGAYLCFAPRKKENI